MQRSKCKELLDSGVLQAYAEGKVIEYQFCDSSYWHTANSDVVLCFETDAKYRVKQEPKYRPFTFTEMVYLLGQTIIKNNMEYKIHSVTMFHDKSWNIKITSNFDRIVTLSSASLLDLCTLNGKPCGALDETNTI